MSARDKYNAEQAMAVGLFYVEQAKLRPNVALHWQQQTLDLRLHYLAKAKALLAKVHP